MNQVQNEINWVDCKNDLLHSHKSILFKLLHQVSHTVLNLYIITHSVIFVSKLSQVTTDKKLRIYSPNGNAATCPLNFTAQVNRSRIHLHSNLSRSSRTCYTIVLFVRLELFSSFKEQRSSPLSSLVDNMNVISFFITNYTQNWVAHKFCTKI